MTDRDKLNAVLDAEPWITLMGLADVAEEDGKALLAAGYRWIVGRKKVPGHSRGRYLWLESLKGKALEQLGESSWSVPAEVRHEMKRQARVAAPTRAVIGYQPWEFQTASAAWYGLALAIAGLKHAGHDVDSKEWW